MSRSKSPHRFPASGCWLHLCNPMIAELVGLAGYDYAMIDMEHGAVGLDGVLPLVQATQLGGAKALVRIPERDPRWVGRLMDLGADGVMVPMVNDAEQARALAAACVYPPAGTRGMAPGVIRASGYGGESESYLEHYREDFVLIVQIETPRAAHEARAIADTDGVDVVFIGPYDFSAGAGFRGQPDHPQVRRRIGEIVEIVKAAGKTLGGIPTPGTDIKTLHAQGYDLVIGGSDMTLLREAMEANALDHRAS